ncbi:MAG: ABC transporter permease [Planctomycetota bacterium]
MLQFWRTISLGLKSLAQHRMRAGLAALGIFIGTTTVIWLVAVGEGISYRAEQQILELGARNIIVRTVRPATQSQTSAQTSKVERYGLLRADYDRIVSNIPGIEMPVAMREVPFSLRRGNRSLDVKLVGCTREHLRLNRLRIARGRWLKPVDNNERVVVLGDAAAQQLFPAEDPVGQNVWVGDDLYTVVGQTRPRIASAAIGGSLDARDYNQDVYLPLQSLRTHIGDLVIKRQSGENFRGQWVELSQITVRVRDVRWVDETAGIIEYLLAKFHPNEDYAVVVPKELLRQAARTRAMFNVLLVVIAGISLLVGGIGIMNIMLATVTERTREIGIRRAIGARRRDIVQQFLVETSLLSCIGGMLGVACGLMCGPVFRLVRWVVDSLQPDLLPPIVHELEPRIALWSIVLSLAISLGSGLVFGVYPARRAAMMNPIDALRHD